MQHSDEESQQFPICSHTCKLSIRNHNTNDESIMWVYTCIERESTRVTWNKQVRHDKCVKYILGTEENRKNTTIVFPRLEWFTTDETLPGGSIITN